MWFHGMYNQQYYVQWVCGGCVARHMCSWWGSNQQPKGVTIQNGGWAMNSQWLLPTKWLNHDGKITSNVPYFPVFPSLSGIYLATMSQPQVEDKHIAMVKLHGASTICGCLFSVEVAIPTTEWWEHSWLKVESSIFDEKTMVSPWLSLNQHIYNIWDA